MAICVWSAYGATCDPDDCKHVHKPGCGCAEVFWNQGDAVSRRLNQLVDDSNSLAELFETLAKESAIRAYTGIDKPSPGAADKLASLKNEIDLFNALASTKLDYEIDGALEIPYRRKSADECEKVKRVMLRLNHDRIVALHAVLISLIRGVTSSKVEGASSAEAAATFAAASAFFKTRADFYFQQLEYYITQKTPTCHLGDKPSGTSDPKQAAGEELNSAGTRT